MDRIEKDYLVCENQDGEIKIIPFKKLDENISEGSVVYVDKNGNVKLDREKTEKRKKLILELQNKLQ